MPRLFAAAFSSGVEFLVVPRFRKKDTVMGMMGHTQGVTKAIRPPSSPKRKICHREVLEVSLLPPSSKAESWSMTGAQMEEEAVTGAVTVSSLTESLAARFSTGASSEASSFFASSCALERVASPLTLNSTEVGGMQFWSLQAP